MSLINQENFKELVIAEVEERIRNAVGHDVSEIIDFMHDEDFYDESFEEEYDLEETVDEVYESSEIENKVVPRVADMGGVRLYMKHTFDADALTYHLKTRATYDTGQYGSEMDSIEIEDADPFALTTIGIMFEDEDSCLADHDTFKQYFEEISGRQYEDWYDLQCQLNEIDEDNEEEIEEFENALRIACEKTVHALGVLNLKDIPVANLNISLDTSDLLETLKDSDY